MARPRGDTKNRCSACPGDPELKRGDSKRARRSCVLISASGREPAMLQRSQRFTAAKKVGMCRLGASTTQARGGRIGNFVDPRTEEKPSTLNLGDRDMTSSIPSKYHRITGYILDVVSLMSCQGMISNMEVDHVTASLYEQVVAPSSLLPSIHGPAESRIQPHPASSGLIGTHDDKADIGRRPLTYS